jgi:polyhydroxybutyrate depolymerase
MNAARPSKPTLLMALLGLVVAGCSGDGDRSQPEAADNQAGAATSTAPASTSPETTGVRSETSTVSTAPVATIEAPPSTVATTTSETTGTTPVCGDLAVGVSEFSLIAGGAEHPVRVFVPSTYAGAALPLVVNWHGLGSNGREQAAVTRYEELAEREGFIAVHPTGVPAAGDSRNSWQLAPTSGERDDLRFADHLLDRLIADWCVDANRVYSTGMSNGGFFTARLVCEMADRLAAASSVAGLYHVDDCAPSRPVPYLAYHGTDDTVVPFDGDGQSILLGAGSDPALSVFFEQVMPDEFAEFAADAGCDPTPAVTTIDDVIRYDYVGCADATPMSFFEVTGGGHTWPNWPVADAVSALFGYTTTAVDATVDSWQFFEQHTLNE